MLVGDLDSREEPPSDRVGRWGTETGEKGRPDRTSTPEGWLGGGRGSHAWRDPRGLGAGGSAPSISLAQSAQEACLAPGPGHKPLEAPSELHWS